MRFGTPLFAVSYKLYAMASEGNAERREVEDYLKKHDLQNILNEIVNATIKNKAEVPLEFLVNLLRVRTTQQQCSKGRGRDTQLTLGCWVR